MKTRFDAYTGEIKKFKQILETVDLSFFVGGVIAKLPEFFEDIKGRLDSFYQAIYPSCNALVLLSLTLIPKFPARLGFNIFSSIELFTATQTIEILFSLSYIQITLYYHFICHIQSLFSKKNISL